MKFLEAKRRDSERMENKALGGPSANKAAGSGTSTGTSAPSGPSVSPQARQLATELGVDLASVKGTGSGGMVTAGDVRKAHEDQGRGD